MCVGKAMGVVEAPEKKMSLLKPYTKFDEIKNMTIDEMAEIFANVEFNLVNEIYKAFGISINKTELLSEHSNRTKKWKKYLESEAEK